MSMMMLATGTRKSDFPYLSGPKIFNCIASSTGCKDASAKIYVVSPFGSVIG
ncbi:hypothetical protein V7183_24650 [Bacillus sp. JJ1127]